MGCRMYNIFSTYKLNRYFIARVSFFFLFGLFSPLPKGRFMTAFHQYPGESKHQFCQLVPDISNFMLKIFAKLPDCFKIFYFIYLSIVIFRHSKLNPKKVENVIFSTIFLVLFIFYLSSFLSLLPDRLKTCDHQI